MKYEDEIRALQKELKETQNVVDEKAEEMYILNEQIEKQVSCVNRMEFGVKKEPLKNYVFRVRTKI